MGWLEDRVNRAQQEQQDLIKSSLGDISKARSGVYADTSENRKKSRVGQKYGGGKEGGYNKDEHRITDPKKVLKRTKELNNLKVKRAQFIDGSYAYKNLDKQIKQFESMRITDKDGNTVGWHKFDDED
jgi:hypothetical protein